MGNGSIVGPVLLLRSPCNSLGDIQRAHAVKGEKRFRSLKHAVVFSTKGDRPLPDMLAGGDCDGDEFFVIVSYRQDHRCVVKLPKLTIQFCLLYSQNEKLLVDSLMPVTAQVCDSRGEHIPSEASIRDSMVVSEGGSGPPSLTDQLATFADLLLLGDIVSEASDAWIRIADRDGPGSSGAQDLASLCQQALDGRKRALLFSTEQIRFMRKVLEQTELPHWHHSRRQRGNSALRTSRSVLGLLYDRYTLSIRSIEGAAAELDHFTEVESMRERDQEMNTGDCGETVLPTTSPLLLLEKVVFGGFVPRCPAKRPNFSCLNHSCLMKLAEMALLEFKTAMENEFDNIRPGNYDKPCPHDVFVTKKTNELLICKPGSDSDEELLWWFDKHGNSRPVGNDEHGYRVASLSGCLRILESLLGSSCTSLMKDAMERKNLADIIQGGSIACNSLNLSQREVVETVASSNTSFRSGFLAVQGPPGSGSELL